MKSKRSEASARVVGIYHVITRSRSKKLSDLDIKETFGVNNNNNSKIMKKCCSSSNQNQNQNQHQLFLWRHRHSSSSSNSVSTPTPTPALLPEDVIFNILLLLPAHILHDVMRYVCWSWYTLINDPAFIREHLRQCLSLSPPGFLSQNNLNAEFAFAQVRNRGEFHVTESRFPFPGEVKATCYGLVHCPFPGKVKATCDGLVVFQDERHEKIKRILELANPITREKITLPPLQDGCLQSRFSSAIAYVPSIACYKVVQVSSYPRLMVLTLGIDTAWRVIDTNGVQLLEGMFTGRSIPYCINGYIYWFSHAYPANVLTLDIDSETICVVPTPLNMSSKFNACSVNMNRWLGLVDFSNPSYGEVWALTSLEQEKWTKMFNIQMDTLLCNVEKMLHFRPNRCVDHILLCSPGGEMVFNFPGSECVLVWHDVKTGELKAYYTERRKFYFTYFPHVNSLVSPRNYF